jgi:hypothetical protein
MKGKTKKSEMAEAPKSRKQPKDKMSKGRPVMVGGAMRSKKMYGGGETMGTTGVARGMGAAVKGGKFRDL